MLASQNIMSSKTWKEDNVLYCSIHAVKGLEFDYVFFIGASMFPEPFREVYPANDALSLNFVANTRARKAMYYLSDKNFGIPRRCSCNIDREWKNFETHSDPNVPSRSYSNR